MGQTAAGEYDAFVARYDPGLSNLLNAARLGGVDFDTARVVSLDSRGRVLVAGDTFSTNFPATADSLSQVIQGGADLFVALLSADFTQLEYATLAGGSSHDYLYTCLATPDGLILTAGNTYSRGFAPRQPRSETPGIFLGSVSWNAIPPSWYAQHGLPSDGSADAVDTDGDGMANADEYWSGTNPRDPASVLRLAIQPGQAKTVLLRWPSFEGAVYTLESADALNGAAAFGVLGTNILGRAGQTTVIDTNAPGAALRFYRVRLNHNR